MPIEKLLTPVGRVVWGNPLTPRQQKDPVTKQIKLKDDGNPQEQYAMGLAIPKADFEAQVLPFLQQEAASGFPNGIPANFSWKYKDGDGVDNSGKPLSAKTGYAGHYVLSIVTTAYCPQVFKANAQGGYDQMAEGEIKTGDYVRAELNIKVNVPTVSTHTPGLYINPNGIEFVGYGEAIVGSSDPNDMFGSAQPAQLPPGASQTPVASNANGGLPTGVNTAQQPGQAAPMQQPAQAAPMQQNADVQPNHGFVQNAGQAAPMQPVQQTNQMPGMGGLNPNGQTTPNQGGQ